MSEIEVKNKIKNYLALLLKAGVKIEKAYLFGSYARNESNDNSDIDLMLVSSNFDNQNDEMIGLLWKFTRLVDTRIEPFAVGLEKFETDFISPIIQNVRREGILFIQ